MKSLAHAVAFIVYAGNIILWGLLLLLSPFRLYELLTKPKPPKKGDPKDATIVIVPNMGTNYRGSTEGMVSFT